MIQSININFNKIRVLQNIQKEQKFKPNNSSIRIFIMEIIQEQLPSSSPSLRRLEASKFSELISLIYTNNLIK